MKGEKSPAAYQAGDFSPYYFLISKTKNRTGLEMTTRCNSVPGGPATITGNEISYVQYSHENLIIPCNLSIRSIRGSDNGNRITDLRTFLLPNLGDILFSQIGWPHQSW